MHFLLALYLFFNPVVLNPDNTKVTFEVDSTWHLIHGRAKAINGKIWLDNQNDPSSAYVEAHLLVNEFDTENTSRDERLKEVMSSTDFPSVTFKGGPLGKECSLSDLEVNVPCHTTLLGTLRIKEISKEISMNLTVQRSVGSISFHSEAELDWRDFGVEDPSILIAKLKKKVKIFVDVTLPLES